MPVEHQKAMNQCEERINRKRSLAPVRRAEPLAGVPGMGMDQAVSCP